MGKILLTCVLALVFGFGGAVAAVAAFHDSFEGPQGRTGLTGAPGTKGPAGLDGADGEPGPPGVAGKAGRAARATKPQPVDLGVQGCTGQAVQVVTDVTITKDQKLRLTKKNVCVVG